MTINLLIEQIQCTSNGVKFIFAESEYGFNIPIGISFDKKTVSIPGFPSKEEIVKTWDHGNRFDADVANGDTVTTYIPIVKVTYIVNHEDDSMKLLDRHFNLRQEDGKIIVDRCINLNELQCGIIAIEGCNEIYILNKYGEAIKVSSSQIYPRMMGPIGMIPMLVVVSGVNDMNAYTGTADEVNEKIKSASEYYENQGYKYLRKCYITKGGSALCFL